MIPNGFLHRTGVMDDAFPSSVRPSFEANGREPWGLLHAHRGGRKESNSEDPATASDDLQ